VPIAPRSSQRAGIAFIPFLFKASIEFLNAVSVQFADKNEQRQGSDKLLECVTAACKTFSLAY
jgi:hypothetical protein